MREPLDDLGKKLEELALLGAVERLQRLARDGGAVEQQLVDRALASVVRLSSVRRRRGIGRESTRPRSSADAPHLHGRLVHATSRPRRFVRARCTRSASHARVLVGVMLGSRCSSGKSRWHVGARDAAGSRFGLRCGTAVAPDLRQSSALAVSLRRAHRPRASSDSWLHRLSASHNVTLTIARAVNRRPLDSCAAGGQRANGSVRCNRSLDGKFGGCKILEAAPPT